MFKRFISAIIIFSFIFNFYNFVLADNIEKEEINVDEIIQTCAESVENEIDINSNIAVIYDRKTGNVVWGKNENRRSAMASTTKIMTAIVTLENGNLDDMVKISSKSAWTGGSTVGLNTDDEISLNDLLYALMLKSGNDAAVAIAEHIGGSVEGFAELMNKKAKDLGLVDTHFVTSHGLDDPEHYTTAKELALIADYALQNDMFKKIVGTKNYTIKINNNTKQISNTNELLGYLDGVYGVKTGFTNNARKVFGNFNK